MLYTKTAIEGMGVARPGLILWLYYLGHGPVCYVKNADSLEGSALDRLLGRRLVGLFLYP